MPVIRVSEDNWKRLQKWAIPLEDTPNDVIGKVLDAAEGRGQSAREESHESLDVPRIATTREQHQTSVRTPDEAYERPLLDALDELGGSARTDEVLQLVERKMQGTLTEHDRKPLPGSGETRWRNTAKFARKHLVDKGLLRKDSPRGTWELVDARKINRVTRQEQ